MVLMDPAQNGSWSEIWRGLVNNISKVERRRTADAETGTRMAAHQQCIVCDILPDPVYGAAIAPTSLWLKLLDQMEHRSSIFTQLSGLLGIDVVQSKISSNVGVWSNTDEAMLVICRLQP